MSSVLALYKDNDMIVELSGLRNEVNGEFINNATVACSLKTPAGVAVSGQTFPTAMDYVAGSDGLYRATLSDAVQVTLNGRYVVEITADAGGGLNAKWSVDVACQTRK